MAIDSKNNIYVLDGNLIRKVTLGGLVSTVFTPGNYTKNFIFGTITVDSDDNILATVVSIVGHNIWRIVLGTYTISPVVETIPGLYPYLLLDGPTSHVSSGGAVTSMVRDHDGNIVLAVNAAGSQVIRKLGAMCNGLFNPSACGGP